MFHTCARPHIQSNHCWCQGEVPLKKVLFDAKLEHDFIKNYKVLQSVFDKKQVTKVSILQQSSLIHVL